MTGGQPPRWVRPVTDTPTANLESRRSSSEPSLSPAFLAEPQVFHDVTTSPRHGIRSVREMRVTRPAFPPRYEYLLIGLATTAYCLTAVFTIRHAASLYLPPDGAHYLGEADNYLGRGVLDFTHPPTFPLLVAAARAAVGPLSAVLVAMTMGLALAYVSVYALLRQWLSIVPSLFGVSVGMLMPINAELLGWAGGAELLGLGFGVATLACFEWWCRKGGGRGFAVGVAFGLTVLSHPFGALVAAVCLGVRWVVELSHQRRLGHGWEPTGLMGLLSVAVPATTLGILALGYYTKVQSPASTTLGLPAPAVLGQLLSWSSRENRFLLIISVAALGTAFITSHRGAMSISAALALVIVLLPILLHADNSYQARAIYYLPVLIAIGGGFAWVLIARRSRRLLDVRRWQVLGAVMLLAIPVGIGTIGFAPRIQTAVQFYGRLQPDDFRILETLRGQSGAVATSWSGSALAEGASMSWYVSGLARRHAYGPSGPWLADQRVELQSGQDMQRAFSGLVGVDDSALQIAAQPAPTRTENILAGPYRPETDILASVPGAYAGFLFPLLALNANGNEYPLSVRPQQASARISDGNVAWSYPGTVGELGAVQETLSLHRRQVVVDFRSSSTPAGLWKVYLRPAAGQQWSNLNISARSVSIDETIGGRIVSTTLKTVTPMTQFQYLPVDPITGTQALTIDTSSPALRFTLDVAGTAPAHRALAFDQSEILSRYNVSDVVVFKSSGVLELFDSACFTRGAESSSLVLFRYDASHCPLINKLSAGTP